MEPKAAALFALADVCASAAGDLHTLHLNVIGHEFDVMHKDVLKTYYEQLDDDYDSAAEWGRCFDAYAPNKNESAARIQYQSLGENAHDRDNAVAITKVVLTNVMEQMHQMYNTMDNLATECPICTGIANWLQTRLEYWAKEVAFFNKAREGV